MQVLWEPWLRNWDEAWYGEIIKNMALGGKGWLMPWWNGRYYFDHPPLYFWLSSLVVKLFGLGEWQVRVVSIMAGGGVVWLTYKLGGKLASLILISMAQVIVRFSHGNLDALMIFLFLLTFYLWRKGKWVWAGISLGLGFLVKGWLLGMWPVVLIIAYEQKLTMKLAGLVAIGMVVFGLWAVPAGIKFGQPMMNRYIWQADAGHLRQPGATFSLKFFEYLVRDLGLWMIPGLWLVAKKGRNLVPLLITSLVFILGLSGSDEKSDWYILPAYPLLAISLGQVARSWNKVVVGMLVIAGLVNAYRVEMMYPDRSRVGAELGRYAKNIIPRGEAVILDDHDFTTFLFYSDAGMVYVPEQAGKAGEWWVIKSEQIPELVHEKGQVWLVTPKEKQLSKELKIQEAEEYQGYKFLKITLEGVGSVADGGTQVKEIGEIGEVEIPSVENDGVYTTVTYLIK